MSLAASPKQTIDTSPATPSNTATQSIPSLPLPETFDILPPLHQLLSRLLAANPPNLTDPSLAAYPDQQHLDIQQLATEASSIKARIRKALAAVRALPDMERTVEEQEEEIEYLESKIRRQTRIIEDMN
ncbi:hypothetical protein B0A49_05149 [Cryomyces minteri]|uniref:Mediator of RNA polymerase II transcription subunit 9 n=1 Tax=Cryomyces minteri TaxID=331657 RepID=A0A4U0XE38_9PEZI|nr:hypothetical protein B0A49_05149 [Cryomyces minteri]